MGISIFLQGEVSEPYDGIKIQKPWIITEKNNQFTLRHTSNRWILRDKSTFDSLYAVATVVVGVRNDSTFLHTETFNPEFAGQLLVEALTSPDSIYVCVHQPGKKTVLSTSGEKLFSLACDRIEYAGAGFFLAVKKDKKIILNANGKIYPALDFDVLGNASSYYISILHKKKFGLINRPTKKIIKPAYDRNVVPYNSRLLIAYQSNAYGFIDWSNKQQSKFQFEEVRYWNDSVALVKINFAWRLYDLYEKAFKPGKISEYSSFELPSNEIIAVFQQDNYYGVMSNKNGVLLEPTFTSIINLGTKETAFYFTEKYVEEAAIYIVIYYDQYGKQVRRQVYEEEDYRNIKCQN